MGKTSDLIYRERVIKKITQAELSKSAGCSEAMISLIEKGHRQPTIKMIVNISFALAIDNESVFLAIADDLREEIEAARMKIREKAQEGL